MKINNICSICGGIAERNPYFESKEWLVNRCSDCSFAWVENIVTNPIPSGFDWGADIVDENQLRQEMYYDRLSRIIKFNPNPINWLDIGCGGGGLLNCAKEYGYNSEGIELGPSAKIIVEEYGIRVHEKSLESVKDSLLYKEYGVVSYFHVLEHIENPKHELMQASELISSDGLLVVEVPFFDSLFWKILKHKHRHFYREHVNYFNKNSLSFLLKSLGFEILSLESVPYTMSIGWIIKRLGFNNIFDSSNNTFSKKSIKINTGEYLLSVSKKL